ncbi:MAG: FAD-dependent oxidoreductase [Anaerolineae bacterium]|nr:FAD-dependent oxidoreductase [Anaerolineae bacterium]
MQKYDYVIIGAGVSGLAAAQQLRRQGKTPLVLEARDRIGGRVLTHRGRGLVDFGAQYIHGANAATWEWVRDNEIVTQAWFNETNPTTAHTHLFAVDGQWLSGDEALKTRIAELCNHPTQQPAHDISFADYYRPLAPADDPAFILANVRNERIEAADLTRLSAYHTAHERNISTSGWGNFKVPNGYDAIVAALAKEVNVQLNSPVLQVDWSEDGAILHLPTQQIWARYVIVTLPLSLLQLGMPVFNPPLPAEKLQAIHALAMGHVCKLVLWFKTPFWQDFTFISTNGVVASWWPVLSSPATLMGYSGGPRAIQLSSLGQAGAIEQGLHELSQLYGPAVREQFSEGHLQDWSTDPWARGAYSYTPVGAGSARQQLAAALANTLFFAGEAANVNGHHATIHGAIERGREAADEAMQTG